MSMHKLENDVPSSTQPHPLTCCLVCHLLSLKSQKNDGSALVPPLQYEQVRFFFFSVAKYFIWNFYLSIYPFMNELAFSWFWNKYFKCEKARDAQGHFKVSHECDILECEPISREMTKQQTVFGASKEGSRILWQEVKSRVWRLESLWGEEGSIIKVRTGKWRAADTKGMRETFMKRWS